MSDVVTRLNTALDGRYAVERELGEGGMATVYLAKDLKHNRSVALKVLKPELAAVVGAERFLAEIETTANLQHPHILPLFDSGEADGFLFYVMPYIEGETLRERIDRERQLPVDEALGIATAVANALQTAHEQGVVHRDIKPGNILLSRGEPLVADFGIAIAVSAGGGGRLTETGLSLGTPYYMSPEQATGDQAIGPASDTFALACVLYEMLVGDPPYPGSTAQAVLGKIIQGVPVSATAARTSVPANVDAAIRKALEKLPADRFTRAQHFARALADPGFRHGEALGAGGGGGQAWNRTSVTFASLFVVAFGLAAWGWLRPQPTPEPGVPTRALVDAEITAIGGRKLAISGDGRSLVHAPGGGERLMLRTSDDPTWRPIQNTDGGNTPSFSPDGQSIAFRTGEGIFKVSIQGGPRLPIAPSGGDLDWGQDDTIVYLDQGGLYRVSSTGGDPQLLLPSDSLPLRSPFALPDGRGVLFSTLGAPASRIFILETEAGVVRQLVAAGNQPRYVATGHVIYAHADGALMGVPFDLETLQVTGTPTTLVPSLTVNPGGTAHFDVSEGGTLFYAARSGTGDEAVAENPFVWVDLSGNRTPLPLRVGDVIGPQFSPDGERIAYASGDHVWVYDAATGANIQLTFEGRNVSPVWSPDGAFIYFLSERRGTEERLDGFRRAADGSTQAEWLWAGRYEAALTSFSPNGRWIAMTEVRDNSSLDVSLVELGGDTVVIQPFTEEEGAEYEGAISPDGRWLAYASNELGGQDVFVRSFPEGPGKYRVSGRNAHEPVWSPDGSALFFVDDNELARVDVITGGSSSFGRPTPLAAWPYNPGAREYIGHAIHPDGERFLAVVGGALGIGSVYIVTDWFEELRRRMAGG